MPACLRAQSHEYGNADALIFFPLNGQFLRIPVMMTGQSGSIDTRTRYPQSPAASGQKRTFTMKEFSCGAIGAIQNSTKPGHMVRIDDDSANSGGFLILEWWEGSTGPNVNGAFDSWVENELAVSKFLQETGWCIVWH